MVARTQLTGSATLMRKKANKRKPHYVFQILTVNANLKDLHLPRGLGLTVNANLKDLHLPRGLEPYLKVNHLYSIPNVGGVFPPMTQMF